MIWMIADFGTYRLKCLKVDIENQGLKVIDYARFESKPEFFEGLGFPTQAAWNALNIGLNEITWITEDPTAISSHLPSAYLETRYIRFPFKSEKKIEKVLPLEIESAVPFDVDELLLRKRLLEGPGVASGKDALVFVTSYRRELIQRFEQELGRFQQSIPPISVDILNLSSLRQVLPPAPVMGLLNIGHSKTQFVLFQKTGLVLAARTFYWGAQVLIKQLQDSLQVNEKRAADLLRTEASFEISKEFSSDQIKMSDALESSLNLFLNEFRRSLKSFQQQGLLIPKATPLYLLGRCSKIKGLKERLNERYRSEFDLAFESFPLQMLCDAVPGLDTLEDPLEAVPAVAQALAQTRPHRGKIPSFSESGFQFQQNIKKFRTEGAALMKKLALLLLVPFLYLILSFVLQGREEDHVKQSLVEVLEQNRLNIRTQGSLNQILSQLRDLEKSYAFKAQALQEDNDSPLFVLQDLSGRIPERLKIDITEFSVTDSKVLVKAETDSEATKTQIVQEVRKLYPSVEGGGSERCTRTPQCLSFNFEFDRPLEERWRN